LNKRKNHTRRNFFKQGVCAIASMHIFLESCMDILDQKSIPTDNRFIEVDLFVNQNDLKSQQNFYSTKLDLQLINESSTGFSINAGKTRLNFNVENTIDQPFYHLAFNIPENKINQAKEWSNRRFDLLIKEGGDDIIHFKKWNAHSIYFMDSGGNILEFIAHHKLNNESDGDFSSDDILYLIEVGLVSQDVKSLANEIKNKTGLKDYIKADELLNSSKFRAMGDTNGMLILSKTGRDWLMTDKAAEEIPLALKMKSQKKDMVHLEKGKYKIELLK